MVDSDAFPTDEQIDEYLHEPLTRLGFERVQTCLYRWPDGPDPDVEIELEFKIIRVDSLSCSTASLRNIRATVGLRHEKLERLDREVRKGVKPVEVRPAGLATPSYGVGLLTPHNWFRQTLCWYLFRKGFAEGQSPRREVRAILRDIRRAMPWIRRNATLEFIASDCLAMCTPDGGFDEYCYRTALALHLLGRSAEAVEFLEKYLHNPRCTGHYGGNTFRAWVRNLLALIESDGYALPAEKRASLEGLLSVVHTPEKEAQWRANYRGVKAARNNERAAMAEVIDEYLAPRGYQRLPRSSYIWAREAESHISVVEMSPGIPGLSVGAWPRRLGDKPPGWPQPATYRLPIKCNLIVVLPLCLRLNLERALFVLHGGVAVDKQAIGFILKSFHGPWLRRAQQCIFEPYKPPSAERHEAILRRAMADHICPFLDRKSVV